MSIRVIVVALAACALLFTPATALAAKGGKTGGTTRHLTIAVQAHPSATDEQLAAIDDAIATWSSTLEDASTA